MESLEHERANQILQSDIDFWQVRILHHVLSEYLSKSYNFKIYSILLTCNQASQQKKEGMLDHRLLYCRCVPLCSLNRAMLSFSSE